MKKNKLEKLKKLSRNDLKKVSGGTGGCTGGHPIFEYHTYDADGNSLSTGGDDGGWVLVGYSPRIC